MGDITTKATCVVINSILHLIYIYIYIYLEGIFLR